MNFFLAHWHPEAIKQLEKLEKTVQDEVEKVVEEFEKQGLNHDKAGKLKEKEPEISIFRLKIVSESEKVNHRILFDEAFDKFVFYGVYHRDDAYKVENLMEILERDYTE